MYRDGVWVSFETTVFWLEVDPDGPGLIKLERTFYSIEERQEFMKERIESGVVYDLISHNEYYGGADPGPYDQALEDLLRGKM